MNSMAKKIGIEVRYHPDVHGPIITGIYGKEVMYDCYCCKMMTSDRANLRRFFRRLVKLLGMKRGDLHFWDDVGVPTAERQIKPETTGTSAIQFILTSNITIHYLNKLERVYVNIFSCKDFDEGKAKMFVQDWFGAFNVRTHVVYRQ